MQGLWNVLEQKSFLAFAVLWLSLTNCSGGVFKSDADAGGAGGSQAGSGGANGGSNDAGRAGSAGSDEQAGSPSEPGGASGGGANPTGCNCKSGSYCREASPDCFPCAAMSRLKFTTPERIATLSDSGQGSRFPRVGATSTDLLYRFDGIGLRYTPDASTSPGTNLGATATSDSAPLLLNVDVTGFDATGPTLFFDRALAPEAPRDLFSAPWRGNDAQAAESAPPPFNSDRDDFSIAVALHPPDGIAGRAYWMSNRNATEEAPAPELFTATLTADTVAETVTLRVGQRKPGCPIAEAPDVDVDPDLTPWVTADGKLMLLSTTRVEDDCSVSNQKKDIHTVLLRPETGQPAEGEIAIPLSDVNSAGDDTDPSFSADLCDLYFASNRDGKYAVYRAHRR